MICQHRNSIRGQLYECARLIETLNKKVLTVFRSCGFMEGRIFTGNIFHNMPTPALVVLTVE